MLTHWVTRRLEKLVMRYFAAHPDIRLVAVVGSVGKASTKRAIGTILSYSYRVRMHDEIEQSPMAVPLAVLGIDMPRRKTIFAWLRVLRAARYQVKHPQEVDVIVQELPTRASGVMASYSRFLRPSMTVITAVSPVHMEQFANLDQFGAELFEATKFSDLVLVNRDDVDGRYAEFDATPNIYTYGTSGMAEYHVELVDTTLEHGSHISITTPAWPEVEANVVLVGEHALRPVAAAVAVAANAGMAQEAVIAALPALKPLVGRMNPLRGLDRTTILDDTMSASPADMAAALQALYQFDTAAQRIAVLGSMSHLGDATEEAHHAIGKLCSGDLLAWVVVVGEPAQHFLAPTARRRGCQVKVARDAVEAAEFVRSVSEPGSVILVKGSAENYLEEAVRLLCDMSEDHKLVRQSPQERAAKDKLFSRFTDNH